MAAFQWHKSFQAFYPRYIKSHMSQPGTTMKLAETVFLLKGLNQELKYSNIKHNTKFQTYFKKANKNLHLNSSHIKTRISDFYMFPCKIKMIWSTNQSKNRFGLLSPDNTCSPASTNTSIDIYIKSMHTSADSPSPQRPSGIALSWIGEGLWKPAADSPSSTASDSNSEPNSIPSDRRTSSVLFRVSMSWAALLTEAAMLDCLLAAEWWRN